MLFDIFYDLIRYFITTLLKPFLNGLRFQEFNQSISMTMILLKVKGALQVKDIGLEFEARLRVQLVHGAASMKREMIF